MSPKPISWHGMEKQNLTQQKHAFANEKKCTTTQHKHNKCSAAAEMGDCLATIGRHTDHPSGRHSIRTNQWPPPPSPHFLQAGCPSCRPTNSVKAMKVREPDHHNTKSQLNTNAAVTWNKWSLHFALGIAKAKCILATAVCLSVCLSLAAFPHYCIDPHVTWGNGRGCSLVVHYWADLQSVHGFRCYDNLHVCKLIHCKCKQRRTQNVSECLYSLYDWF